MQTDYLITGGSGMVGTHLKDYMPEEVYISSRDYDLRDKDQVKRMFELYRPKRVIHLAAKVGGIMDNIKNPVSYFEDNFLINHNVLSQAYAHGVERFTGILSTCVYPDKVPVDCYPLSESRLHDGPPAATNFSYGYAKRSLAVQIDTYNKQYGTEYNYLIPCNLYSEYDHFEGDKAHFVTSLIHKIALAKLHKRNYIELYGTGQPLRQFMYARDLARAIKKCTLDDVTTSFNVATDEVYSIATIAQIALIACDATHLEIKWDISKPDGQYRKDASNTILKNIFPKFKFTSLKDGIKLTYDYHYKELAS
jgi:GDP-L-fucose synthase